MPRNSSGTYQAPASSFNPAINGSLATAGDFNALLADISAALTDSLSRGGNGSLTANLAMGSHKITGLTPGTGSGDAVAWEQLFGVGVMSDIASAATVDIGVQNTSFLRVTGTTTITSFGTNFRGPRFITFEGAVTLTNSSTLVLPGNANITTAAGDSLIVIPGATAGTADKWVVVAYQKNAVPGFTPNGSITTEKIANNAITPAKLANGGLELGGFRNRIINGDMRIDQRNAGAAITLTNNLGYPVDRFMPQTSTTTWTVQRSTIAPTGFVNSLGVTNGTGGSPAAGNYNGFKHEIEGFNTADLGFGTANAQTFTLSFWVRSSVTGTYAGRFANAGDTRVYVFTYTISAANTWEYKTITVAGDTSGTWATDNSRGIQIIWDLGSGSNFNGTAGSWGSSNVTRTSGSVNWIATNGATFYITGVQLEAGSVATPFERRPYGTELMLCQRYFISYGGVDAIEQFAIGQASSATLSLHIMGLPVEMRTTPSLGYNAANGFRVNDVSVQNQTSAMALSVSGPKNLYITATTTGLTLGRATRLMAFDTNTRLTFNAEL